MSLDLYCIWYTRRGVFCLYALRWPRTEKVRILEKHLCVWGQGHIAERAMDPDIWVSYYPKKIIDLLHSLIRCTFHKIHSICNIISNILPRIIAEFSFIAVVTIFIIWLLLIQGGLSASILYCWEIPISLGKTFSWAYTIILTKLFLFVVCRSKQRNLSVNV